MDWSEKGQKDEEKGLRPHGYEPTIARLVVEGLGR
jgi:hypothetical protein